VFPDIGNVCPNIAFFFLNMSICSYIILPVALYGCETWSVTLRDEHRLRVFENRELRKIFGPKGEIVSGEWRKLHTEELHDLHCSANVIRTIKSNLSRYAGQVARMGREEVPSESFWWGSWRERDHLQDLGVDGKNNIKINIE